MMYCLVLKIKIKFIYGDLTNKKFVKTSKVNLVIHLVSMTNSEESFNNKKFIYFNNLDSFKNIIKFCKKFNSKLIIFLQQVFMVHKKMLLMKIK